MDIVTIRAYDDVHDKIVCDPGLAHEIADYFTFDVPGAKFTPQFRNKVWDGKIRLFNPMVSLLYCGLRQHLEQFCKSRDYKVEYEGSFGDNEFSLHEANAFIAKLAPKHAPRDYQMVAFVHAVRKRRIACGDSSAHSRWWPCCQSCTTHRPWTLFVQPL